MEAYEGVAVGGALVRSWLTGHPPLRAAWAASDWTGAGAGAGAGVGALAELCMGHSGFMGVSDCDEYREGVYATYRRRKDILG